MKKLLVVALLLCGVAQAEQYPLPDLSALQSFDNELDAAKLGLAEAAQCSGDIRECGGVIYESHGRFYPSHPLTSNKPFGYDGGPFFVDPKAPNLSPDIKIVADYHVHICNQHNASFSVFFSPADATTNDTFKIAGYMYSFCDGMIRAYIPKSVARDDYDVRDDEEVDFKSGKVIYLTIGHIVGSLPPQKFTH